MAFTGVRTRRLLLGASLVVLNPAYAHAQEVPAAPSRDDSGDAVAADDIVVTAQRRSESIQRVPIAITSVNNEQLATVQATDVSALRGIVPSLTISGSAGINTSNLISIRGVGGLAVPIGTSQATGIYAIRLAARAHEII